MPSKQTPPSLETCFIKGRDGTGWGGPRLDKWDLSCLAKVFLQKKQKDKDFRLKEKALWVILSEMSPAADWLKGDFVDEPHSCS